MKNKIYPIFTTFIATATFIIFSSFTLIEDPFAALLKKLEELSKKYPQEKVHLHLDKPYYAIGDDVWFKAYVVDARTDQPTSISNILYVELLTEQDSLYQQLKLPMQNGITWGDFKLADTLNEGNYRIRAYTQLMRNLGSDFFFDKNIKIGKTWNNKVYTKADFSSSIKNGKEIKTATIVFTDPEGKTYSEKTISYEIWDAGNRITKSKGKTDNAGQLSIELPQQQGLGSKLITTIDMGKDGKTTKTIPLINKSSNLDVQFFPEGGYLVQGLSSKIAIKAIDLNGLGKDISGRIIDETGIEVATFSTSYLGMGSFFLNPLAGKSYTAEIKLYDGSEQSVPLPKAQTSGYLLSANNTDAKSINVKITISANLLNKGDLNLIAHKNGEVKLATKIPSNKQLTKISLEKSELPSGIIQLTLFSPENIPVAERIVFVKNSTDKIDFDLKNLKQSYGKREKVELNLTSTNIQQLKTANFSVAVTDAAVGLDIENESNIFTDLLLTSDLVGKVEKPNHYFISDDVQTNEQLDHLLLTQGWRKIDWKAIANDMPSNLTFPAEKTMNISGTITKGNKALPRSKITLMSNKGGVFMIETTSDANGKFIFEDLVFADSTKFLIQARSEKDKKDVKISLDILPSQAITYLKNNADVEVNVNSYLDSYLSQSKKYVDEQIKQGFLKSTILLNEVKIVAERPNPAKNSRNLNGAGNADQVFEGDAILRFTSVDQFLVGRIAGVTIRNGRAIDSRSGGTMAIMMDGMNMGSDFTLYDINPLDIESIEVLRSITKIAIYGPEGASGILFVTTRRGKPAPNQYYYAPGVTTYFPKGYYNSRTFYSPKYDTNVELKPDLRTTVYWDPQLIGNENGEVKFNYYNTDNVGIYRIVIEGIDALGNLARKVYTYEVK